LLGFGGGPRTCIGKHLAFLESKIMLIKLFKRYSKISVQKERLMKLNFIYEPNEFNTIFEK
jgi:cytochrome P450